MKPRAPGVDQLLNSLKSFREIGAGDVFVTVSDSGWAMHDGKTLTEVVNPKTHKSYRAVSGIYPTQADTDLVLVAQGLHDNLDEKLNPPQALRPAPA